MTITYVRETAGQGPRRRLPIQIANEAKMIRATIELLESNEVDQITSRMIAERSGTATNYISRYFGGRDGLLAATADELGHRIADQIDAFAHEPGDEDPAAFLVRALAIPESVQWFRLFRHLVGRNLPLRAHPGDKPPLIMACDAAIARVFRIEGDDAAFWSNVFVTYTMGNMAFGSLLGTTPDEGNRALARLAAVVQALRADQVSPVD